ncbi:hypothetical protein [Novosphingobium sp. Gsoil 351]|uniref:hypothetical protein n=1 Tax=Novosphingobium sp. Gsoil 351 TaxID=2675225 RepID=UPI0012B4F9B0|nr:hypothetical protein [Novosphingobium sp. Gsoil 351]QGN54440.1 hypothetical protein GKE62_07595 [Novosphingobium sp. Gsoil 351]
MRAFQSLPARSGRIAYRHRDGRLWGEETWSLTRDAKGNRCLTAHCEMAFGSDDVVRDSILAVDAEFQPLEAYVRILNHGVPTGSGWFRFAGDEAEGESFSNDAGRLSQRMAIERPMRGFGIHALMGDGWLSATFPFAKGPGTEHFFGRNLLHSLHHFGASGPRLEVSTSGLRYEARETITVPAGTFDCHRVAFVGMTNAHPPYVMWISADGDFLYVRGVVEGYMDSVFELEELRG